MICKVCNIDKNTSEFYKNRKKCKSCLIILRSCIHNIRKNRCKDCKLIDNKTCTKCNLNLKLEHFPINSNKCNNCLGSKCIHNKKKNLCKDCNGVSICLHNKYKINCVDCNGTNICIHKKHKRTCKDCKGPDICIHNRIKSQCKDCKGSAICIHNKIKRTCKECKGSAICIHNTIKYICKKCFPNKIMNKYKRKYKKRISCTHNKRKEYCFICSPNSKALCKTCHLFRVNKSTNYLCSYCNPESSKKQKTKENRVKQFLEEHNYTFVYNKKCNLNSTCQKYFPDFLIDCNTFFLIIECDEDSHSSYPIDCEKMRENNICYALGLPCVFIRFNPDKSPISKKKIKIETKEKVLKSYIEFYKSKEIIEGNEVCYLFY